MVISRFLYAVFFLVLILGAGLYAGVNTPLASEWLIRRSILQNVKGAQIQSLVISRQRFYPPGQLILTDIQLVLKKDDDTLRLNIRRLILGELENLWRAQPTIKLNLTGLNWELSDIKIQNLSLTSVLTLQHQTSYLIVAEAESPQMDLYSYKINDAAFQIVGNRQNFKLKNITAQAYDGRVEGEITLKYNPAPTYSMDLKLMHIDLSRLKEANPSVFSQVDGKADGTLSIEGRGREG